MRPAASTLALLALAALACGCGRREPPSTYVTGDAAGASPSIAPLPASIQASANPPSSAMPAASRDAAAPSPSSSPPSAADDPGTLPQTRDRPGSDGDSFNRRSRGLWEAIATDDPEKARPFFFPVTAYEQVKDIPQPSGDWNHRLWRNFARDIHAAHARVVKDGATPKLVSIDVPDDRAKWVDPGHEVNKIGYWRVFGTKIRYDAGGEERTIDVTSLISWRGEWYVVHLTGFK